jgi:hypothetical protein
MRSEISDEAKEILKNLVAPMWQVSKRIHESILDRKNFLPLFNHWITRVGRILISS